MTAAKRLLAGTLLLVCGAARADWFSGNAGVVSDTLFRGLDQTNGPALQGGLDYVHHSGLYGGAWLTNNRSAGSGGEADLYGGYTRQLPLFGVLSATLDAGVAGYVYSGERQASLGGGNQDFAGLRVENPGDDGVILGEVLIHFPTLVLIETILNLMQVDEPETQIVRHFERPGIIEPPDKNRRPLT